MSRPDNRGTVEYLEMMAGDPAITRGVLAVEYFKWYGSAALPTYLEPHKRTEKVKILVTDIKYLL
jgi:uncharacterized protein